MNLSSLVHVGRYQPEHHNYSYKPRPQQAMASPLATNSYTAHSSTYSYITAPQPPPSPPVDETSKCYLPSISSLLGMPDAKSPKEQTQQASQLTAQQQVKTEYRPTSSHQYGPSPIMSSRGTLPPTPPMQSEPGFDGRQSPSAASNSEHSVASAPGYYYPAPPATINSIDSYPQRQHAPQPPRRVSMPASMGYQQSSYQNESQYGIGSSQPPMSSYYPGPMQPAPVQSQISGLYYQRPLPQQFPPMMPVSVTLTPSSGTNPWQHHHYISPSAAASFPQSQDRYVCQTCNKAFSRPSSLRIHSHSHTGEKPFKCPHQACGKAFSVRSNMKRHERGCHIYDGVMLD